MFRIAHSLTIFVEAGGKVLREPRIPNFASSNLKRGAAKFAERRAETLPGPAQLAGSL